MNRTAFEPKIVSALKEGYGLQIFAKDLAAGIIVGIVALPLSIAFAIASGVQPAQGLITAVVAGLAISCFSGSRYQVGGPTGAFIVIVYGIVQKHGYEGLAVATIMAGLLLIIMGIARLGDAIKFIPYPVTVGFTSGIALIILTTQIRDFFGMSLTVPDHFIAKWNAYAHHLHTINWYALALGLLTIFIIMFWPRLTRKLPGTLIAIILTTMLVECFRLPVDTIGSRFGTVPNTFPMPQVPHITVQKLIDLSSPALAIALLAGIESLLSCVVADGMTGRRHRSNIELIGQGIANIISPIFGGIPATGAIARTATNIKNGGQTPVAGIIHALTVLLLFLCFGKWAAMIPMATLAGILIVVAYNMSEWQLFAKMLRSSTGDVIVLLITFLLTVLIDLTVAIEVGVILAAFLFMHRMVEVTHIDPVTNELNEDDDPESVNRRVVPPGVEVYEINGPFFFGATDKFKNTLYEVDGKPKVLILRMRYVPVIDATALRALEEVVHKTHSHNTTLILSSVNPPVMKSLKKTGLDVQIGPLNIQPTIDHALERAHILLSQKSQP